MRKRLQELRADACRAGGKIMEVGCGAGVLTVLLAHHGYQVLGVDDDEDIAEYARCLERPVN